MRPPGLVEVLIASRVNTVFRCTPEQAQGLIAGWVAHRQSGDQLRKVLTLVARAEGGVDFVTTAIDASEVSSIHVLGVVSPVA